MDSNEFGNVSGKEGSLPPEAKPAKLQPVSSLKSLRAASLSEIKENNEAVKVDVNAGASDPRGRANQAIDIINVAAEATSEIEKLVKGIDGILSQADPDSVKPLPEQRLPILEQEASQLLEAIRRQAKTEAPSGVRPLAGDKVSLELEKLGKTLEILLPDDATDAFGINVVRLTSKDAILTARASVAEARERLKSLRDAIGESHKEIRAVVSALDVAFQNSEASRVSIRDVDEALKVVDETSRSISGDPSGALGAVRLNADVLSLLEG